jgi:hypothetical protein
MNVSAINCTPIKPKASFAGAEQQFSQVVQQTNELRDSFVPEKDENGNKSVVGTALSLATAGIVMYAGGKFAASKLIEVFPKAAEKLSAGLVKAADSKVVGNVSNFLASKNGKIASKASEILNKTVENVKKPEALKNVAGGLALAIGLEKIATVDGNKDGINDIAQKNVNAYENAMKNMDLINAISRGLT